jgi:hypothetical protein
MESTRIGHGWICFLEVLTAPGPNCARPGLAPRNASRVLRFVGAERTARVSVAPLSGWVFSHRMLSSREAVIGMDAEDRPSE